MCTRLCWLSKVWLLESDIWLDDLISPVLIVGDFNIDVDNEKDALGSVFIDILSGFRSRPKTFQAGGY